MYLIAGLGNPGTQFAATKHNIGFEVIERLAYDHGIQLNQKKHKSIYGTGVIGGQKVILVQPQTFMNRSGESIGAFANFYKIPFEQILIVYDDSSLELGQLRIRKKGSAGGHNGVKNVILHLGTQEFPRVKVGVGQKPPGWDLADYVMGRFTKEEVSVMVPAVKRAADAIDLFVKEGVEKTMNQYNGSR